MSKPVFAPEQKIGSIGSGPLPRAHNRISSLESKSVKRSSSLRNLTKEKTHARESAR